MEIISGIIPADFLHGLEVAHRFTYGIKHFIQLSFLGIEFAFF
jgi:hypothetical protein